LRRKFSRLLCPNCETNLERRIETTSAKSNQEIEQIAICQHASHPFCSGLLEEDEKSKPLALIAPPTIMTSISCQKKSVSKGKFDSCPFPLGPSTMNRVKAIMNYSLKGSDLLFLVMFEYLESCYWVHFRVLIGLEPKNIFINWLRGIYLFYPCKRLEIQRKAKELGCDHELELLICDCCRRTAHNTGSKMEINQIHDLKKEIE
jgi:hypothetical protein